MQSRAKRGGPRRLPTGVAAGAVASLVQRETPRQLIERERPAVLQGLQGRQAGPPGVGSIPDAVHEPGGDLLRGMLHPAFEVYDGLFETLPEEGMFNPNLNPSKPFQWTLGSFKVPEGQALWLSDYDFGVLLFDGVNPGDYRVAEAGRFRGVLGFDLTVMERRQSHLNYQLDPVPVATGRQQFEEVVTRDAPGIRGGTRSEKFFRNQASSFAAVSGQGTSLLPAGDHVQGPRNKPWTWIIEDGDTVAVKCVIFRPLRTPIGGVYGRLAGHLIHVNTSRTLVNRMYPR